MAAAASATIQAGAGNTYVPPCIRVSVDPSSPIAPTTSGSMATFTMVSPGAVPYYRDVHTGVGMHGAIFVE